MLKFEIIEDLVKNEGYRIVNVSTTDNGDYRLYVLESNIRLRNGPDEIEINNYHMNREDFRRYIEQLYDLYKNGEEL